MMEVVLDHRWSGWPGAWCLDCGIEDQNEIFLAVHGYFDFGENHNPLCPEPGSNRCNPYAVNIPPTGETKRRKIQG
jgi:hypothetical protein